MVEAIRYEFGEQNEVGEQNDTIERPTECAENQQPMSRILPLKPDDLVYTICCNGAPTKAILDPQFGTLT